MNCRIKLSWQVLLLYVFALNIPVGISATRGVVPLERTASPASKSSTTIDADVMNLNYIDHEKRVVTFEGNVVAVDPQLTLKCDRMVVYFDKSDEATRVEAYDHVQLSQQGKTGTGDKAIFEKATGTIVLSGIKPTLTDEKGNKIVSNGSGIIYNIRTREMKVDKPSMDVRTSSDTSSINQPFTTITADLLNYNRFDTEKSVATFEGNVVAVDPQLTLKCRKMVVNFDRNNQVNRVEAYESVRMTQPGKEGVGEKAVFEMATEEIVLSGGRPTLTDDNGYKLVSYGKGIVYNTRTKLMTADKAEFIAPVSDSVAPMPSEVPK